MLEKLHRICNGKAWEQGWLKFILLSLVLNIRNYWELSADSGLISLSVCEISVT